jgi:hypothetical protein
MREASEWVLPGFPLRTDAKVVRHPDRYVDDRGRRMWDTVRALLDEADAGIDTPGTDATPGRGATPGTGARKPLAAVHTPPGLMSCL